MAKTQQDDTFVKTQRVRFSYAHVFEPKAIGEGSEPKYSVSILIDKSDKVTIDRVKRAVEAAKAKGKESVFKNRLGGLKLPLRDGDEERPDDEDYQNCYFLNANNKRKPGIIGKDNEELYEDSEFYSGCYGRVSLQFFAFNTNGNKGIGVSLQNIKKLEDGERLGGARTTAMDDFGDDDDDMM